MRHNSRKRQKPLLRKLRIIELIKGNFQLITCMHTRLRNDRNIEDKRLSKCNYRLRRHYSIESGLLEKRLLCNTSKCTGESTMHLLSCLESYYNW